MSDGKRQVMKAFLNALIVDGYRFSNFFRITSFLENHVIQRNTEAFPRSL